MILYKYLHPTRLDVLENKEIRFTQPGDFNDPFEFRPCIQRAASEEEVRTYVENNFEKILEEDLAKYGALVPKAALKEILLKQKNKLPEIFQFLEPQMLQKISPLVDSLLNQHVGVLCLSEVRDSLLMWGHYTDSHKGFVVGFDSNHPFFSMRKSKHDEFGFLRRVSYQLQRPCVVLSDTTSPDWFQTKSEQWAYEKEWRIVRVLSEAERRVDRTIFPIYLFNFPPDAVLEIIIGMRSTPAVITEIRSLAAVFPRAKLLKAVEDPSNYNLIIDEID